MTDDMREIFDNHLFRLEQYIGEGNAISAVEDMDDIESAINDNSDDLREAFEDDEDMPSTVEECKLYILSNLQTVAHEMLFDDLYEEMPDIDVDTVPSRKKDEAKEMTLLRAFSDIGFAAQVILDSQEADNPSDITNLGYIISYEYDEVIYPDDDRIRSEIGVERTSDWKIGLSEDCLNELNDHLGQIKHLMED